MILKLIGYKEKFMKLSLKCMQMSTSEKSSMVLVARVARISVDFSVVFASSRPPEREALEKWRIRLRRPTYHGSKSTIRAIFLSNPTSYFRASKKDNFCANRKQFKLQIDHKKAKMQANSIALKELKFSPGWLLKVCRLSWLTDFLYYRYF